MLSGILKALQQPIMLQGLAHCAAGLCVHGLYHDIVCCLLDMPRLSRLLQSLTSVARFSTIVLFLSEQEKEGQCSCIAVRPMHVLVVHPTPTSHDRFERGFPSDESVLQQSPCTSNTGH